MESASVTTIRRRRPRDPLVDVVLDSGEVLRLHDRRVAERRLGSGARLAGPGLDGLRCAAAFDDAEQRALRLLARRPRSVAELRARMSEWGVDDVTAAGVVERLAELGQVDDRRLAAAVAESRHAQGYGRRRTRAELARLAVGDPAAEAALALVPDDELPDAVRIVERRFGAPPYDDRTARRAVGFLARRGFAPDAVAAAVGRPELD
ncbi:MAG TPA: regulatory protein RecX [Gaiellales bacterium]|jgi:regulatory protein